MEKILFATLYITVFGGWGLTNMILKYKGIREMSWFVATLPLTGSIALLLLIIITTYLI